MGRLIDGKELTRDEVVVQYEGLVYKHARRLSMNDYHYIQDLAQEGFIGLLYAYDRYDAEEGASFTTYATQYVLGYMSRAHDKRVTVNVPVHTIRSAWQIDRGGMWELTDKEISEKLSITESQVEHCRIYFHRRHISSVDAKAEEGDDLYNSFGYVQDYSTLIVEEYSKLLDDREKFIAVKLCEGYSQTDISRMLGVSKMRVSQIVRKIREKVGEWSGK